jgi:hypothetical protein
MTQTFKVGDKVEHRSFGKGEIAFGPFDAAFDAGVFLMAAEDGKHYIAVTDALTRPAKFAVGDKVKSRYGTRYTVEAGPFFAPGEWYALRTDESGNVVHSHADEVSVVELESAADESIKVGDVVRILKDGAYHADVKAGDLFEVKRVFTDSFFDDEERIKVDAGPDARMGQWTFRPEDFEKVPADKVAVHDDVVYDLAVRYRDRDGDYWTFAHVGDTVRGYCVDTDRSMAHMIDESSTLLAEAVRRYGPLARV